jgi:hypothetical protein
LKLLSVMSKRVRGSLTTAVVLAVAGAVAMVGLVWVSIWATAELRAYVDGWAPLLIGLLLFTPLIAVVLARTLKAPPAPLPSAPSPSEPAFISSAEPDIGAAAKAFVQRSPLTALALGALTGLLLARSSGALSRLLDALDDTQSH